MAAPGQISIRACQRIIWKDLKKYLWKNAIDSLQKELLKKSPRKISRKIAPERVLAKSQENRSVLKLQIDICMFTTFLFLEIISAGVGNVMAVLRS